MADLFDRLRSALADRYTIERELGRGGNATVYLARDLKHDRQVALKVLAPELAHAVRTERFLREIQIAARLTHPHILPLHESGEAQGFLYYVMPYVPGESLRERLQREKQLSIADALRLTQDVAEALGYAHAEGVVHRDIKPENILLSAGGAVVADFGIAAALSAASSGPVTETGLVVGTPAYMSPEQGSGGAVDARSDVYSLGCVVYEMLTGRPPYAGDTAQEMLARHALDPIPTVRAARLGVPQGVEQAVARALAKQPADRFATAAQFAAALAAPRPRLPVYAAVGLLVLVGAGIVARQTLRGPSEQSVAVLPFVNLSGDTTQEYFSDGVTEEVINALTQIGGVRVPARTSAFAFKGRNADIGEVGRRLNVAHLVEGSVRRSGDRLRVTAQLIKVADGYHLWSETYDRELASARDVIAVQEDIARAIVSALKPAVLAQASTPLTRPPTEKLDAYELYMKGRFHWNRRTEEALRQAIDYFNAAIARDSSFALAYSGLADTYVLASQLDMPKEEGYPKAEAAARKAVALNESLVEGHVSLARALARVFMNHPGDPSAAEREYQRALELNPRYALARSWYGLLLNDLNRSAEAIRETKRGVELDPLSPGMNNNVGVVLMGARRWDEAIEYLTRAVELEPDWDTPWRNLSVAHFGTRRFDEAIAFAMRILERAPTRWQARRLLAHAYLGKGMLAQALTEAQRVVASPFSDADDLARLGSMYGRTGNRAEAGSVLARLRAMSRDDWRYWQRIAVVYAGLGPPDSAFAAMERTHEAGFQFPGLTSNPTWDPLRSDRRFARFLKKVGGQP